MSYQPPVYSPLSLSGIASGLTAALGGGSKRDRLESLLHERFGADVVVLTSSGTHALQLAISALAGPPTGPAAAPDDDAGPGGRPAHPGTVALPAYSCYDLVTAAIGAGVRIRFYDVDPVSLSPDLPSLERAIADGVSGVVAGNLYGLPLEATAIRDVCRRAGVPFIEDAAQGIGATTPAGDAGTLGDASILSFGRGKGWTGGGGGALLLRTPAEVQRSLDAPRATDRGLRSGATTLVAWALGRPALYGLPASIPALGLGTTRYHEPSSPGSITDFSARLALSTAASAHAAPAKRRAVAEAWRQRLSEETTGLRLCRPLGGHESAGFLRFPVVAQSVDHAKTLVERGARLGVAPGYPIALHRLPQGTPHHAGTPGALPGSEELAERLVTLPTHHWVDGSLMQRVIDLAESALR